MLIDGQMICIVKLKYHSKQLPYIVLNVNNFQMLDAEAKITALYIDTPSNFNFRDLVKSITWLAT